MTVKDLMERLKNFNNEAKVNIVSEIKSNKTEYSITYSPIQDVRKVTIGCGVYVVGIVMPQ